MNFGWSNSFGAFGGSGGVKSPASPEDIIWWAKDGVTPDTLNDVNDIAEAPQLDDALYVGNNALAFAGAGQGVSLGSDIVLDLATTWELDFYIFVDANVNRQFLSNTTSAKGRIYLGGSGAFFLTDDTNTNYGFASAEAIPPLSTWVNVNFSCDGLGEVTLSIEGNNPVSKVLPTPGSITINAVGLPQFGSGLGTFDGVISKAFINGYNYKFSEGSGLPYDAGVNENHALTNTTSWTTAAKTIPWNIEDGFRVAVQQTAPYIPARTDGSGLAADGGAITNLPSKHHNGAESLVRQTDVALVGLGFWTGDMSYADYRAHLNGGDDLWLKCVNINGVSHIDEAVQYDLAWVPTLQEEEKNKKYFGDNCGTGFATFAMTIGGLGMLLDAAEMFISV